MKTLLERIVVNFLGKPKEPPVAPKKTLLEQITEEFLAEQDRDLSLYAYDTKNKRLQPYDSPENAKDAINDPKNSMVDPQRAPDDVKAALDGKDDGEEKDSEETPAAGEPEGTTDADGEDGAPSSDQETQAAKDARAGADHTAIAQDDDEEKRRVELSKIDDDKVDEALEMTKTRADKLKKRHSELKKMGIAKRRSEGVQEEFEELQAKGIGAGTPTSRAGEAMTHAAIRMRQDKPPKSWDEIREHFKGIVSSEDHVLSENKDWVDAAISCAIITEQTHGLEHIVDVAWDTPEGREAVGVDVDFDTAADMFVTVKDPESGELKRVGISLKKDGRVFIFNGGWKKQHKKIRDGLEEQGVSDELLRKFDEASGIDSYWSDLNEQMADGAKTLAESDAFASEVDRIKKDDEYARKVLGVNYETYRKRLDDGLLDRIRKGKGTSADQASVADIKVLARIAEKGELVSEAHPEIYSNMRNSDHALTERTMRILQENPELESAMKRQVLDGIHLDNILGLVDGQDGGVDEFMTVYGIQPEGSVLDEDTLTGLFGPEFATTLAEELSEVRSGDKDPSELKDFLAEKMVIDYERGTIMFSQEFPDPDNPDQTITSQYPLFTLGARSRSVGASPTMELQQTSFMAYSLSQGTPDVNQWEPEVYRNYLTGQITSTRNEVKAAKKEGRDEDTVKELELKLQRAKETKEKSKAGAVNASVRPLLRSLIIRELDRIKNGN